MNSKYKAIIFTLVATLAFSMASCSGSGGKSLNSAEDLKAYLDKQPANTPDKPIRVTMNANAPMLPNIVAAINSAGKYVSLNLSGNALKFIPEYAFSDEFSDELKKEGCELLVAITLPDSVTSIWNHAFEGCTSLSSVIIPNSVTNIEYSAFKGCTSLSSVTIPNRVIKIGQFAFYGCTGLTSVKFESNIAFGNFGGGSVVFNPDLDRKYLSDGIGTYTRPKSSNTWTKQ
jgi:hypothetical protein